MQKLTFLFDFISPYAWLAWRALPAIEEATGTEAEPVPVLFAGLLNVHGQLGPAEIPAKRVYIFKDAVRRARIAGWPLTPPPSHPFNPLAALRLASLPLPPEKRRQLIDRLFQVAWGGDRPAGPNAGLEDEKTLRAIVGDVLGEDESDRVLAALGEPEAKGRLRGQTEDAIAAGVFGVPTFLATGPDGRRELFWGFETVDLVTRFLRDGDLISPGELERWSDLPASAERRRPG